MSRDPAYPDQIHESTVWPAPDGRAASVKVTRSRPHAQV